LGSAPTTVFLCTTVLRHVAPAIVDKLYWHGFVANSFQLQPQ